MEYEYFEAAPVSEHTKEISKPYESDLDFAFFAVKLHWTKKEYEQLTQLERLFILKEIERQTVENQELFQQTVELAVSNVLSKKGRKYKKLWKKKHKQGDLPITYKEAKQVQKALSQLPTLAEVISKIPNN